jgi:Tfp pilus assembly protein PilW
MKISWDKSGISLVEGMVVTLILSVLMGGVFLSMSAGGNAWHNTSTQISLSENLRRTIERVSRELRETGYYTPDPAGAPLVRTMYVTIFDNTGFNNTDIIRFSIPIVCEAGGTVINASSDVANWGAPLTWGCNDSTCMDADDDCATLDYSAVEYLIDSSSRLIRRVLDDTNAAVREDIFAHNVTNIQAVLNANAGVPELHQAVVTLTITVAASSDQNRQLTQTATVDVYLRNRG